MTNLEPSRFNFFAASKNNHIVYNSRTGALISVSEEKFGLIQNGNIEAFDALEAEKLCSSGIFVDFDEVDAIDEQIVRQREMSRFSQLVITPTLACNFQCPYCFQNDFRNKHRMPNCLLTEIIDAIEMQKDRVAPALLHNSHEGFTS